MNSNRTANSATPVLAARTWPLVTHAGDNVWHVMCETCGQTVQGLDVGGAMSAHTRHVTEAHGLNRDKDGCSCATHGDGSVTTMLCPSHADTDPCATMAAVTGRRRSGSVVKGVCSTCGWTA